MLLMHLIMVQSMESQNTSLVIFIMTTIGKIIIY